MHMCSVLCVLSLGFVGCSAATTDCSNNAYAITCSVIIIELLYVMSRLFSFERGVMWRIYEHVSGAKTDVYLQDKGVDVAAELLNRQRLVRHLRASNLDRL